jgi:hypothetical protein
MFTCLDYEHCINILLKFSLKIQVWNYCNVVLLHFENFKNIKFNVEYLHKGHKINISCVRMNFQYLHLKHKMLVVFLDGLCNTQMLGIKYACPMKKIMMIKI